MSKSYYPYVAVNVDETASDYVTIMLFAENTLTYSRLKDQAGGFALTGLLNFEVPIEPKYEG